MNRLILLLLFILSCHTYSYAIYNEETLLKELNDASNDSIKCLAYYKLIAYYRKNNPELQLAYIRDGIQYANKIKDNEYLASYYAELAQYKMDIENLDSALYVIKIADSYLPGVSDIRTHLVVLTKYSDILVKMGDIEGASRKYFEALKIAEENNDQNAIASCYMGLASLFFTQNMYNEGYKYIKKFECQCPKLPPKVEPRCLAVAYTNIANYFQVKNLPDSTIYYATKAIQLKTEYNDYTGLTISYNALASAQILVGDTLSAMESYEYSLQAAEVVNHKSEMVSTLAVLGNFYLQKKDVLKLDEIYKKASPLAESISSIRVKIEYFTFKAGYLSLKHDYKGAYEALMKKHEYVIESRNDKNSTLIADLETKYKTDKIIQEKELAEANNELSKQAIQSANKQLLYVIIFSIITLILLIYIFIQLKLIRKKNKELDKAYILLEESKKYELAASNLKALKSQMNPHFIFNALNSIQDLIMKNDIENSYDYIVIFAELVRSSLSNSNNDYIPIDEEFEFLEIYLKLEKLRFGNEFNYEVVTNGIDDIYIPSLIIQPFLENALLHGLMHKKGQKELTVEFILEEELLCIITDNGVGREEARRIKERRGASHESFALNAIKERLELLSETFETTYKFEMEDLYEYDLPKGTKIKIQLPHKDEYYSN